MKRKYHVLIMVAIIFSGGFAAGIYYTKNTYGLQSIKQPVPASS
ncbi:hypothetical protein [Cytobacillus firmus]|nr:hypothetical protein [Cytobacillus firmus]